MRGRIILTVGMATGFLLACAGLEPDDLLDMCFNKEEPVVVSEILQSIPRVAQEDTYETYESVELTEEEMREIKLARYDEEIAAISTIEDEMEWYKQYRVISARYSDVILMKSILDEFTAEEVRLLCQLAETETYQRGFEEKSHVVSVALNRYRTGRFGSTLKKVITKPAQFAYGRQRLTESSILAVLYVYEFGDTAQGCLYFHSFKGEDEPREKFQDGYYVFSDDAVHHFYK